MALDGLVISNIVYELNHALTGGHIGKIYQPEPDALVLVVKNNRKNYKLLISASASLPLLYMTDDTPGNPAAAPNFCMLLRKHIGSGSIVAVEQPGMERIVNFRIEHLDELGDVSEKILIVEIMGKHSNIIFCQPDMTIIDSIKRVSANISSVREVLPGRKYFITQTQHKLDPLTLGIDEFRNEVLKRPVTVMKAIYGGITGISPIIAEEICFRAGIESSRSTSSLEEPEILHLFGTFGRLMDDIREHHYYPNIVYGEDGAPVEFSCTKLNCYSELREETSDSISEILRKYYAAKNSVTRMRQKSSDLRKITGTLLDRCRKKYSLQQKQLKDTEKRDKYRIYGEMINTYGYELEPGAKELSCINFYDGKPIRVPLDPMLTAHENSVKYFDRYAKLKRTSDALNEQLQDTKTELAQLESIQTSLEIATDEETLAQVKEELIEFGYIKGHQSGQGKGRGKKSRGAKNHAKSRPYHYISSDGFDIYVGKNNYQNEELTFSFADNSDWWFHAKGIPGSHVIVKCAGREIPDRCFEEAANLAAYYSRGRDADKVEVDYIQKKFVKKTPGGRPGFVIYHTNYSMMARPDIGGLKEVS